MFAFWAAAPVVRSPVEHRGTFVHLSIHLFIHSSPLLHWTSKTRKLTSKTRNLPSHAWKLLSQAQNLPFQTWNWRLSGHKLMPLWPWIGSLLLEIWCFRVEICPLRPEISLLSPRPQISPFKLQICFLRPQIWLLCHQFSPQICPRRLQTSWREGQIKVLCSTGFCLLWGHCPASSHSNSQSYKEGWQLSLTTHCPWASCSTHQLQQTDRQCLL